MKQRDFSSPFGRVLTLFLLLAAGAPVHAAEGGASKRLTDALGGYAKDTIIQKGLVAVNSAGVHPSFIEKTDRLWQQDNITESFLTQMRINPCGKRLKEVVEDRKYLSGAFALAQAGQVACMVERPRLFDFSKHPLVKKALGDGKAAAIVSDPRKSPDGKRTERDVLVPVRDPVGYAIGVIWFTVDEKKFEGGK